MNDDDLDLELHEALDVGVLGPHDGKTGSQWDVVLIAKGFSKNRGSSGRPRYYSGEALRRAVREKVFEGLKACAYRFGNPLGGDRYDHLHGQARATGKQFVENVIGFYKDVRYGTFRRPDGTTGEGVLAKLCILEGADWLRKNMRDAWSQGRHNLYGLSIDADGMARPGTVDGRIAEVVHVITSATSTDVVSEPAAGGTLLRLAASHDRGRDEAMLNLIKSARPAWLEGVPPQAPEQPETDFVTQVVERRIDALQAEIDALPAAETAKLQEQGASMQMLRRLAMLLKDGKAEEAMKLLQAMLAAPANGNGSPAPAQESQIHEPPAPSREHQNENPNQAKVPESTEGDPTPAAAKESIMQDYEKQAAEKLAKLEELTEAAEKREVEARVLSAVSRTDLKEATRARIVERFSGRREVKDTEIQEAIAAELAYLNEVAPDAGLPTGLGDSHEVPGHRRPHHVEILAENQDKLRDAWDGAFAGKPVNGLMFHSLQEAWGTYGLPFFDRETTGELIYKAICAAFPAKMTQPRLSLWDNPLGRHQARLRESWDRMVPTELRETVTTSDWSVAFGDAFNRRLEKEYTMDPRTDWRRIISSVENLGDWTNPQRIVRIGGIDDLPLVAEKDAYTELTPDPPTEQVEIMTPEKRGGKFTLSLESVIADRLNVIRSIPRKLARSANRTIHKKVWDQLETNPLMADGTALIDAAHANALTGLAFDYPNMAVGVQGLREQTEQDVAEALGLAPKFLVHGPALEQAVIEVLDSRVKVNAGEDATVASSNNRWGIQPFMTLGIGRTGPRANDWWLVADPNDVETIAVGFPGGRDRPDIFVQGQQQETVGSVFDSDCLTFKIRLICAAKAVDWRAFQSNRA